MGLVVYVNINSDFAIFMINAIFKNPRNYQNLGATIFINPSLQYHTVK